jgi:hypothetical protein
MTGRGIDKGVSHVQEGGDKSVWEEGDGTGLGYGIGIGEGIAWGEVSVENPLFDMNAAGELDFTFDDHAFLQWPMPNGTTMMNGDVQCRADDNRSGAFGDSTCEANGDFDAVWGLGGDFATELNLMFPDPRSPQGQDSLAQNTDSFFDDFSDGVYVSPGFHLGRDTAEADLDMMMTGAAVTT